MKALLTLLILFPVISFGQDKWWKIDKNDVGVIVTQAISGGFDGWNQNISHHHWGRNKPFWDINTSWQRKYRDWPEDTRSAFPMSKNILATFTDGFHLTRSISRTATLATIAITVSDWRDYPRNDRWKVVVKKLVLSIIANRVAFAIVYR